MDSKMRKFKKEMFVQTKNLKSAAENSVQSSSFIDPARYMVNGEFQFRIPPEAPVFEPTAEEFLDPLAYILKIKPQAEKTGICKIKPPPDWNPPFAVDVDSFKFTPRIQKLHELEGNTRIKLYFLDRLATFWNCQGTQIRIPAINDKTVDMYSLYTIVKSEGGFDGTSADKKWYKVATRMGYVNEKTVAPLLKTYYRRLLLPYENFEKSVHLIDSKRNEHAQVTTTPVKKEEPTDWSNDATSTSSSSSSSNNNNNSPAKQASDGSNSTKRRTRSNYTENDTEILVSETFKDPLMQDKNKELQRLTFYGPGPKILGSNKRKVEKAVVPSPSTTAVPATAAAAAVAGQVTEECTGGYACVICKNGVADDNVVLCDGCEDSYHISCLIPPLNAVPKGEWRCAKCIWAVINKSHDAFGFEQSTREYTLQQFGEMADQFKSTYFGTPVHLVPTERVEHEYWRIMSSLDSTVAVEYGADLHSMDHGSGFPTQGALEECGADYNYYKRYVESSWNLNNIPVLEGSVLGYIDADISGMKIPWMYVGMCFSTFCWHNEDHWSYSINYLHWGEPKTWYGVPGPQAEAFQKVMQQTAPDLFYTQPDLLHQLVTILNPNVLMDKGIPVYHINQRAGEFVLTFPRSYHAGFNHGYNFAEAVNFAPADWIPIGRMCIDDYSSLHRMCVFAHDELICKIALYRGNLNSTLMAAACEDMEKMMEKENKQRKALLEWGVLCSERVNFELLADDARQCVECNTTCFLSAVKCKCNPDKLCCLRHYRNMCDCSPLNHSLKYRYTLDELLKMLKNLKVDCASIKVWAAKVHDALDITTPRTITLSGLRDLLNEAVEKRVPEKSSDSPLKLLSDAIKSVETALSVNFNDILSKTKIVEKKLKLVEVEHYYDELKRIPCVLPQEITVVEFLEFVVRLREKVAEIIDDNKNEWRTGDVEKFLDVVNLPNVDIPEVNQLQDYLRARKWLDEWNNEKNRQTTTTFNEAQIDRQLSTAKDLVQFPMVAEKIKQITEMKNKIRRLKQLAETYLTVTQTSSSSSSSTSKPSLEELQNLADEMHASKVEFPERKKILAAIKAALEWKAVVVEFLASCQTGQPHLYRVQNFLKDTRVSIVRFQEEDKLQSFVESADNWKRLVKQMFVNSDSEFSLLETITPRIVPSEARNYQQHQLSSDNKKFSVDDIFNDLVGDNENIIDMIEEAEKRELELILSLRFSNITKRIAKNTARYCFCNTAFSDGMKECALCRDLFHAHCLNIAANNTGKILCSCCRRSKRPSVDEAIKETKNLKMLRVQLFEGQALVRLVARATAWKTEVNNLIRNHAELGKSFIKLQQFEIQSKTSSSSSSSNFSLTIDETDRLALKKLLIRGDLIELSMSETCLIWNLLKYSQRSSTEDLEQELTQEDLLFKSEILNVIPSYGRRKKRRSLINNDGQKSSQRSESSTPLPPTDDDRLSSSDQQRGGAAANNISSGGNNNNVNNNNNNNKAKKPRMKSTRKTVSSRVNGRRTSTTQDNNNALPTDLYERELLGGGEEEEDNGKPCDMKNCLQPTADHVDWVQCDSCQSWLHMICAGVNTAQVESQTEFICRRCSQLKKSSIRTTSKNNNNNNNSNVSSDDIICID